MPFSHPGMNIPEAISSPKLLVMSPMLIGIIHESYDLRITYKIRRTAGK